jgi:hypothetical protein
MIPMPLEPTGSKANGIIAQYRSIGESKQSRPATLSQFEDLPIA